MEGVDTYKLTTFILALCILGLGFAYLSKTGGLSQLPAVQSVGIKEFSYVLMLLLPNALIAFGPIADTLNQELRHTWPALAGFASIFLNTASGTLFRKIADAMASKPVPTVGGNYSLPGCFIPGFESQVSEFSSAPLVVTFTILMYYLIDLFQNRGFFAAVPAVVATLALGGSQFMILKENGCFSSFTSVGYPLLISLALGTLFGGVSYAIVKSSSPNSLPTAVALQAANAPPPTLGGKQQKSGGCSGGNCGAPSDDDTFVCDSYINGLPVTK